MDIKARIHVIGARARVVSGAFGGASPGAQNKKGPDHAGPFHGVEKEATVTTEPYFGKRLHWLGRLPLNWKFAPTTIGWSEVTLTVNATSVTPSNPGPPVVGMTQVTFLVRAFRRGTVVAPASPG